MGRSLYHSTLLCLSKSDLFVKEPLKNPANRWDLRNVVSQRNKSVLQALDLGLSPSARVNACSSMR